MDVIHTAIWVSDMDEARAFFVDGVGLQENWSFTHEGIENVYVGGEHGEIQLRYAAEHPAPDPDRTGHDHVGISVEDVDAAVGRVRERTDATVLKGPMTVPPAGSRVAFLEGVDGYVIELVEQLD